MNYEQEQELELLNNELRRERQEPTLLRLEDIHPSMSDSDRQRALDEILCVLKGDA